MSEPTKKRKRNADGSKKSSKKVAVETPVASDVRVTVVQNTDDWAPIVASTPGLAFDKSLALKPYSKRRSNAPQRPGQSGLIATNELLIESSEHPAVDYVGREEEVGGSDSLLKHYIGVYDPKTGGLQVIESRRMTVRGIVRAQKAAPEAFAEKGDYKNMRDLRNDLGQTFGTKKSKKAIASLTENAISKPRTAAELANTEPVKHDAVTAAMLRNMAEVTSGMATQQELQTVVDESKPRPRANLDAENPKDVYTIDDLIGAEIMKVIPVKEWQDAVKAKEQIITSSKFVSDRIQLASSSVQKLKVLRYLLATLEFYGATIPRRGVRALPKKDELRKAMPGIPEAVAGNIQRKFSDHGMMSKFQMDLLITNVCALALIVDNFEVDVYDLREDLKLEARQMQTYFSEIGARIMAANEGEKKRLGLDKAAAMQHKFARLRLPLEFPKAKFARK
ncbi:hypothetical protein V492_05000 [Pseudogymnoascus sp. VKM F-4246]|nr:hypothetical protein V492_05000 [Pseudogymnoascus sp. VKM F-4246]